MTSTQTIILILGVPLVLLGAVFILLGRASNKPSNHRYYEITILGNRWVAKRYAILQFLVLLLLCWWLDWFLPFSFALLFFAIGIASFAKTREVKGVSSRQDTAELLSNLSKMQKEISTVKDHVELLSRDISIAQSEIEAKEVLKVQLEEVIRKKSEEAKGWKEMTTAQRQAFLETAVAAMSKESRGTFWWGIVLGFFINLLAALAWALLGNPGKDELLSKVNPIAEVIGLTQGTAQPPNSPASATKQK